EAYSLAILLLEYAEQLENPPALQIFATDLSEEALRRARAGFYLDTIAMDLAPERLARFFVKESDGYRVGKELREIVLFATHSLLRDPPFSKIDLISCRNVLIYLQRSVQRQLLELFHYALVSDGYLFLGSAETTDTTALFQDVNRRCNIFQANRTESATVQWLAAPLMRPLPHPPVSFSQVNREGLSDAEIFHLQLLEECAPPRVIVNADYEIIYFSEGVSRYLYQPRGEPTNRVLRRICEELRVELTTALFRAFEHGEASQTQAVSLQFDGRKCWVVLDVRPALTPHRKGYAVLFFHEYADEAGVRNKSPQEEQTMRVLEEELQTLRLQLQTTVEEYEISKEEMRASHEELLSMNEELRSTTEELETSKEELQSINEELFAVNRELKNKVAEVTQSNNNFQNLLISTDIATLFLDRTLRIAFYTPPTTAIFNFIPPDRGRPLAHLRTNLHDTQLEADARQVLAELRPVEREVQSLTGQWFLMRMRPYRTAANQIEGVVITFVDITERKAFEDRQGQLLQEIEQHRSRLRILNQALATAQENERKGLVRTLHDRVGQSLVALNLTLKLIQQEIATQLSPSSQAQTRIVEAQRFIKEVTEQIRNVMAELHPPMLDDYGLLATLKWYAIKLGQQSNIRVDVQGPEFTERLGENTEVTLFRIAQEAMTNAVKHGQLSSITVAVAVDGHQIKLQITDNGRGIGQNDGANAVIRPGWGILSMQERATAIGGRL
ncbi:MAG: PAS domain-containing protein, partial [Caldilineaceae bacterium]|nr:PAS domain-containing protein [Caldilineaceae bacterium]